MLCLGLRVYAEMQQWFKTITHRRDGTISKLPKLFKWKVDRGTMEMRSDGDPLSVLFEAWTRNVMCLLFVWCNFSDREARMMQKFVKEIQVNASKLVDWSLMREIHFIIAVIEFWWSQSSGEIWFRPIRLCHLALDLREIVEFVTKNSVSLMNLWSLLGQRPLKCRDVCHHYLPWLSYLV